MTPLYILMTLNALVLVLISYNLGRLGAGFNKFKNDYWDRIVLHNKMDAAIAKDAIMLILLLHTDSTPMPIMQLAYRLMQCNIHCTIPRIKQYIEEINKDIPGIELTYNN